MYNVAICDDTEVERLQAAEYAGRFFDREGIEVHIDTYAGGRELLESGREYDLYLLDVLMPGMSGIDTAQALAEDKDHPVWYSSHRLWNQLWRDTAWRQQDLF